MNVKVRFKELKVCGLENICSNVHIETYSCTCLFFVRFVFLFQKAKNQNQKHLVSKGKFGVTVACHTRRKNKIENG